MPKKAKKYYLMTKDIAGKVTKRLLSVAEDSHVKASTSAIRLIRTGNYDKVQVIYQPDEFSKPRVVISYFPKHGVVWFQTPGNTPEPVEDIPNEPPGGVFLND